MRRYPRTKQKADKPKPRLGELHLAAATDVATTIQNVLIERGLDGKGYGIATNGYIIARRPFDLSEHEQVGLVPHKAVKLAARPKALTIFGQEIEVMVPVIGGRVVFGWEREGTFPNYQAVMESPRSRTHAATVKIDFAQLEKLVRAMSGPDLEGKRPITLHVGGPLDPIYITTDNGAEGAIMPIRM